MPTNPEIQLSGARLVIDSFNLPQELAHPFPPWQRLDSQIEYRCNLDCMEEGFGCWGPEHDRSPGKALAATFAMIDNFAAYNEAYAAQYDGDACPPNQIIFTGGEPLLAGKRLIKAVHHAIDRNVDAITISSNLIRTGATEQTYNELLEVLRPGKDTIAGPLDGVDEATTNSMRPGSARLQGRRMVIEGLNAAMERGIITKTRTVIARDNLHIVPDIIPAAIRDGLQTNALDECKYYQNAPYGPDRGKLVSADEATGAFLEVLQRNQRHNLTSKLQLHRLTDGRYTQVDPDIVAYTNVLDRQGYPQEIIFGDMHTDFLATAQEYQHYYGLHFALNCLVEALAQKQPDIFESQEVKLAFLSSLVGAAAYDSAPRAQLQMVHDRPGSWYTPPSEVPLVMQAPPHIEIDLKTNDKDTSPHRVNWSQHIDALAKAGLQQITLCEGWEQQPEHQALLSVMQDHPTIRLNVVATHLNGALANALEQSAATVIVPLQTTRQQIAERLRPHTMQIFDQSQRNNRDLLQHLQQRPGLRTGVRLTIHAGNAVLASRIPAALRAMQVDLGRLQVELVEGTGNPTAQNWRNLGNIPLKMFIPPSSEHRGFENPTLQHIANQLSSDGVQSVATHHWGQYPGQHIVIDHSGHVSGSDLLDTGAPHQRPYGALGKHSLQGILDQYKNHVLSIHERQAHILEPALTHGAQSILLDSIEEGEMEHANWMEHVKQAVIGSDVLAAYFYGRPHNLTSLR